MRKGKQTFFQLLVILSGLVMACVVILLCSSEPWAAIRYFFTGPFQSRYTFGNFINTAVPLTVTGLAATISFSASVWNLGTEGMVYAGMITGTYASLLVQDLPPVLGIAIILVAAFAGGAVLSWLCNILKSGLGVNIMMSSLLIANAVFYLGFLLVKGPMKDTSSGQGVTSFFVGDKFMFPKIFQPSELDTGVFLALALTILVYFALRNHRKGFEISITGRNEQFARYGGINTTAVAALAMLLSGGLAGVGGMMHVLNEAGRVRTMLTGIGWSGLSIAMISRNNPALVVPVALFFSFLQHGAESAAMFADITPDVAQIIQGAILLLVTSEALFDFLGRRQNKKRAAQGEAAS